MNIFTFVIGVLFWSSLILFILWDKSCTKFLRNKYCNVKKSDFKDLILLYNKLSIVQKLKFKYLVVHCGDLFKLNEDELLINEDKEL